MGGLIGLILFVGVNVAFLTSEALSQRCLLVSDQCADILECHAADTGHDNPPGQSEQTQYLPVVVLSTDAERHTAAGIKYTNTHFNVLSQTRSIILPRPSTH